MSSVRSNTRRETQFLKVYAIHTMLTPSTRAAHLVMFNISVPRDPKKTTTSFNGQNPTLCLNGPISTDTFQNPQFSGPSLSGMTSSTLQPHFLSEGLLWQCWLSCPCKIALNDDAPELRDSNSSKRYQTEW